MINPIYNEDDIQIYCGDCLKILPQIKDKSVDLVLTDPPYNIKKCDWDKIDDYIKWCGIWILECQRLLKDNGSFYFFHNDMLQVAQLMEWLRKSSKFVFKQFIVWNKRFKEANNKGYLDGFVIPKGLRNYQQMAEYCLFYTFQDETGLTTIKLDMNNFSSIRKYFKDYQEALGMTKLELIEKVGQQVDHCFRWGSSQWGMPTKETYEKISLLPIKSEFLRREYEDLRREYEDLRYTFNNQGTHHSVWDYEIAERNEHITPKPIDLIKNIIKHSSNKNYLVLDPFLGLGTTAVACKELGRKFIGIEISQKYCDIAIRRIKNTQKSMF